ncbi:MAG TPA: purine-nucleoside phosphorylase [Trebonia sp.]|nr:purine-nucleoside phosphorylase [Trebonia sp.]
MTPDHIDPYALAEASAARLAAICGRPHANIDTAIVLGSGWIAAADAIGPAEREIPLADLAGFPAPSVPGHQGGARLVTTANGTRALLFLGRVHLYEGHQPATMVHSVRTAIAAGARTVILTNAAGGLNPSYGVGQPVLISDHLNLTGRSPLSGPNPPQGYPSRFTDLSALYSPRLRLLARELDPTLAEGVYAAVPGPHYETPAEIRMMRAMGADLVGMSTVMEAIAARHLGVEVLAISLVTNPAAGLADAPLDHADVVAAATASAARIGTLLAGLLEKGAGRPVL